MHRLKFWERKEEPAAPTPTPSSAAPPTKKRLPPPRGAGPAGDPVAQGRLDQLRKRRELVAFDLERAESARRPDNPWQARMALLDESLATIEADLSALDAERPVPGFSLPPIPITGIEVDVGAEAMAVPPMAAGDAGGGIGGAGAEANDAAGRPVVSAAAVVGEQVAGGSIGNEAAVAFRIGDEAFRFAEETDWNQRGGPVVRGELRQRAGEATRLVPAKTPPDRRDELAQHLVESVIVFATDLRDRALDGEPLPTAPTLADLARPCPECGGWRDWRGHCDACATRSWRRQTLLAEAERLAAERDAEEEDRYTWAERLPVARRRLADVDAELAKLGGT